MNDLPLELIASLEEGDVGRLRVEANAYHSEIKVFVPSLQFVAVSDPPPHPWAAPSSRPRTVWPKRMCGNTPK